MPHKVIWKRNVNLPEKISWEHRKLEDEVFMTPERFNNPKGSWVVYYQGKIGGYVTPSKRGLDVIKFKKLDSKKQALGFARRTMQELR